MQNTHNADIDFARTRISEESFGNTEDRILGSRLHVAPPCRGHGSRSSERAGLRETTRKPDPNQVCHLKRSTANRTEQKSEQDFASKRVQRWERATRQSDQRLFNYHFCLEMCNSFFLFFFGEGCGDGVYQRRDNVADVFGCGFRLGCEFTCLT